VKKSYTFLSFPNILCINLQRFKKENLTYNQTKIKITLDNLNLLPFLRVNIFFDQLERKWIIMIKQTPITNF